MASITGIRPRPPEAALQQLIAYLDSLRQARQNLAIKSLIDVNPQFARLFNFQRPQLPGPINPPLPTLPGPINFPRPTLPQSLAPGLVPDLGSGPYPENPPTSSYSPPGNTYMPPGLWNWIISNGFYEGAMQPPGPLPTPGHNIAY